MWESWVRMAANAVADRGGSGRMMGATVSVGRCNSESSASVIAVVSGVGWDGGESVQRDPSVGESMLERWEVMILVEPRERVWMC
jgi:hypothetical protein